jgi:hypothetical protein
MKPTGRSGSREAALRFFGLTSDRATAKLVLAGRGLLTLMG